MRRHIRQNCKIARTDEGMELLFEHTVAQRDAAKVTNLEDEVASLKRQLASTGTIQTQVARDQGTINNGQMNNININLFGDRPMALSAELLLDAIRSCPSVNRFSQIHDDEKFSDANRHIIHGSIMDLTTRSHETPEHRNIFLSRQSSDQAMVMSASDIDGPKWEVLPLADAIKTMVAGMSKELRKVGGDHTIKMEIDDRGTLCGLGFATLAEGDVLAGELRSRMMEHLASQRR